MIRSIKKNKLSIIVPVYNERATIQTVISRLLKVKFNNWNKEVIIVDDGSTDGSRELLRKKNYRTVRIFLHANNRGKGAAIRTGIDKASGDYIIIQDADLEYNPKDIQKLLKIVDETSAMVVYGSRFKGQILDTFLIHRLANSILTMLTNILYGSKLSDMETCYKLIRTNILRKMNLSAMRFEFEPEVTARLLLNKIPITEVPISYVKRTYSEGKKINALDFFEAIFTLIKCRFFNVS